MNGSIMDRIEPIYVCGICLPTSVVSGFIKKLLKYFRLEGNVDIKIGSTYKIGWAMLNLVPCMYISMSGSVPIVQASPKTYK